MPPPFTQRASWIWSAEGTHAVPAPGAGSPSHYQVRRFRRTFELADPASSRLVVHVSADSRYLFFCNGKLIGRGPAKGDINHHFYETYDLTPELRAGRNVLAALVLDMSHVAHRPTELGAPCSVMTYAGGFVLDGIVQEVGRVSDPPSNTQDTKGRVTDPSYQEGGASEDLSTDTRWKVAVDTGFRFQNENTTFEGYHGYFEHRVSSLIPENWEGPDFDDRDWLSARVLYRAERLENRRDPTSPYGLLERMVPALTEGESEPFADVFFPGGAEAGDDWRALLKSRVPLKIPAGKSVRVVLDVGRMTTAYPRIETRGGAGAQVRLTYAEALRLPWTTPGAKMLGRPQSLANLASHFADESKGWTFDHRGEITGWCDRWEPAGRAGGEVFEPWHWRAFRYVALEITTAGVPLEVRGVGHRFTIYPYRVDGEFACSDERLNRIWQAGVHTMRLCSHETFDDCPHYEQMQYAGDTMITSRIGMLVSGDYRLSRQALYHFDWSRVPDGLTQSRYPSRLVQVIPSWSLHWITNTRDYTYCSGDLATALELLPGLRAVLDWFRRHGDADGLPAKLPYWNITDWCPWWPRGVVPGADAGPTCIIAAQYILALDEVADLCRLLERTREADELAAEAAALRPKLHARFWSETEGLYFDRPGGPELSQYGNAWAVVCGAAGERERARVMQRFPADPKLAPGSFFWWHAGFRALDLCGAYDRMPEFLGPWREMVDNGLSTFVEENSYWRSLCHAWSAHPVIEFHTRVLGVTPRLPGFAEIEIAPHRCGLAHAAGSVCTPRGLIEVAWRVAEGKFHLAVTAPAGTALTIVAPNGSTRTPAGGRFEEAFALT